MGVQNNRQSAIMSVLTKTPMSSSEVARKVGESVPATLRELAHLRSTGMIKETFSQRSSDDVRIRSMYALPEAK